jgi:hypothetical protein
VELKWWPVAIAGLACLAIGIGLATLLPMPRVRRRLRPLAHVDRLTRLPEYTRVVRLQFLSMLLMVTLLVIVFLQALLTSSRPAGLLSSTRDLDAAHPEDIMLCVGQPVTDAATATFLNYFAQRTVKFNTQRIGLTSPSLRVVPLTRDYQYAADKFSHYAELAALQRDIDANKPMAEGQSMRLRTGIGEFSWPLDYVDYARTTQDVLTLCIAGFPAGENNGNRRRSVVYLGPGDIRRPDEQRPSLFTTQQVKDIAAAAGVQVNVISEPGAPDLQSIAAGTGGSFEMPDPAGTGVDAALDRIRANPPRSTVAAGISVADRSWDSPDVPLIGGIVVSALLCISLAVLRR